MARPPHEQLERDLTRSYEALAAGDAAGAEGVLRKALARHPGEPRVTANLVNALERRGRHDEALAVARASAARHPGLAYVQSNLGALLKFAGDLDGARAMYRRAVELAPDAADAWHALASLKRFATEDDADLVAMRGLLGRLGPADPKRIPLLFAAGRALEDLGQYDEAFQHFERGGRMKRAHLRHDAALFTRLFERAFDALAGDRFARGPVAGAVGDAPILVVGMPRSGTTLIEQILASHPEVVGVGECTELERLVARLGADPFARIEGLAGLDDAALAALGRDYVERLAARAGEGKRVVDKSLDNHLYFGALARAVPNARLVHVRRGALDNVVSCLKVLFTSPLAYTYDQVECARAYLAVNRLAERWRERAPGMVVEVEYEALVRDQVGETRRLLAGLGLSWSERCLEFGKTARRVDSASAVQVRGPLVAAGIGAWERYGKWLGGARGVLGAGART